MLKTLTEKPVYAVIAIVISFGGGAFCHQWYLNYEENSKVPACLREQHYLRRNGYSDKEIEKHMLDQVQRLSAAGFSKTEVEECFGIKQ